MKLHEDSRITVEKLVGMIPAPVAAVRNIKSAAADKNIKEDKIIIKKQNI